MPKKTKPDPGDPEEPLEIHELPRIVAIEQRLTGLQHHRDALEQLRRAGEPFDQDIARLDQITANLRERLSQLKAAPSSGK